MALFPTNHILTQGSLHYRLATLGYQKRNIYGVEEYYSSYNLRHFMQPSASFHRLICVISSHKTRLITRPFVSIYFALYYQQCCHLKLTLQRPPQFQRLTTPLSLRRGAGGEALFPSNPPSLSLNQRSILPPLPCMFAMISASLTRFWSPIIVFFNAEADRAKSRQC